MARELDADDMKQWQEAFERKKDELDANEESETEAKVTDRDDSRLMLGDTTEGDEWLQFEYKEVQVVEQ